MYCSFNSATLETQRINKKKKKKKNERKRQKERGRRRKEIQQNIAKRKWRGNFGREEKFKYMAGNIRAFQMGANGRTEKWRFAT